MREKKYPQGKQQNTTKDDQNPKGTYENIHAIHYSVQMKKRTETDPVWNHQKTMTKTEPTSLMHLQRTLKARILLIKKQRVKLKQINFRESLQKQLKDTPQAEQTQLREEHWQKNKVIQKQRNLKQRH